MTTVFFFFKEPFPTYSKSAGDVFETVKTKICKNLYKWMSNYIEQTLTYYFTWLFKGRLLLNQQTNNFNNLENWKFILIKSRKYCNKRWNCSFSAISPFIAMFSKFMFNSRCQMLSLWSNGLKQQEQFPLLSQCFQTLYATDASTCFCMWEGVKVYRYAINSLLYTDRFREH